jgi:molecular chaperone GrpE
MRAEREPSEVRPPTDAPDSAGNPETPADADARIAELESRCADLEARWLRTQADYQNARRRAQQELDSALFRTLQPLLDELLLVADYLDLALATPASGEEAKAISAGVALTRSKLVQALEQVGVRPIPTTGAFDPALHDAAESRATSTDEPGTILATLRSGYTWQERILRPARVVVAASADEAAEKR